MKPLSEARNGLILAMADADRELLSASMELVELEHRACLERPGVRPDWVYFPESALGSYIAIGPRGRRVEAGIFGRDGMSGSFLIAGADSSPNELVVQYPGASWRLSSDALVEAADRSKSLHTLMLKFLQVSLVQTGQTALTNSQASIEERLSRWLLMCHDRIDGDTLSITHEFLSLMMGVRRAGVTIATHELEGKGLIRARRGAIVVLDREGLERNANGSYGVPEEEYRRLIG